MTEHMYVYLSRFPQHRFANYVYGMKKRVTRQEKSVAELEEVMQRTCLPALAEPRYPIGGREGRKAVGVARKLRMYFLQQWFGLVIDALDDAIYVSQAKHTFVGFYPSRAVMPDSITLMKFRRVLEEHKLTKALFEGINTHLAKLRLLQHECSMRDATIIAALPSPKNEDHARDAEMPPTKKGKEWHYGIRAHIGADADSGLVQSLHTTPANEAEVAHTDKVLHGREKVTVFVAVYTWVDKRAAILETQVEVMIRTNIEWNVSKWRSAITKVAEVTMKTFTKALERVKAQIRSRAEHPFHAVRNQFKQEEVRFKHLAKNDAKLYSEIGLASLEIAK